MKNGVMMQYFEWNLPNDGLLWIHLKEDAAENKPDLLESPFIINP